MKKKKKRNRTRKNKAVHEIIGVVTTSLGLFLGLAVYFPGYAGSVGSTVCGVVKGLFGLAAYVLPFVTIITGILIIIAYHRKVNRSKLILSIVTVVLILGLIHLFFFLRINGSETGAGYINFIVNSYDEGINGLGTGALSALLVFPLYSLFGLAGSYIFIVSLIVIDLLLLTNLSLKQLSSNLYSHMKQAREEHNRNKAARQDGQKRKKLFVGEVSVVEKDKLEPDYTPLKESFTGGEVSKAEPEIKIIDFQKETPKSNEPQSDSINYRKSEDLVAADETGLPVEPLDIDLKVRQEKLPYLIPPISLLKEPVQKSSQTAQDKTVLKNARLLEETLQSFGVVAKVLQVSRGPVITRYELQPAPGVKVSRIVSLADDIALNLAAQGVRIEAPIPGKAAIGIEVPNSDIAPVYLREVLESESFTKHPSKIAFALGKDIAGKNIIADIDTMPHLLIAGATGSGKSVCLNTIIISLLYKATPDEVKLILIDPKVVELSVYNGIPHLLIPVVTDPKKAAGALNWAVQEMVSRYKLFANKGVRDFHRYNEQLEEDETPIPQIVIIIDELSDLMMVAPNEVEDAICRLAQMARAAGIHLVIATQRPSVDVITGVIKANIPSRIAFAVSSQIDSRTILDIGGAEKLLGRGDMLFAPAGSNKPFRVQGAYITEKEVEAVVNCIKNQNEGPQYNTEVLEEVAVDNDGRMNTDYDELFPDAVEIVIDAGQASISLLQRRLRIGYARAARLIDEMENRGLISGFDGSRPRNVLITRDEFEQLFKES
ncbi:MAG TPA: DNA translocase FtsK [Candidatus Atribacteria bacterium]|nr:DNA translocase FtsK [Candidatus Atribacteria bacterium]